MPDFSWIKRDPVYRAEVAETNLIRIRWFLVAGVLLMCGAFFLIAGDPVLKSSGLRERAIFDMISGSLFLLACRFFRCNARVCLRWKERFVLIFLLVLLAGLDSWYFAVLPILGQNSDYILGVIIAGSLFLIPPGVFGLLLGLNHLIYCFLLLRIPLNDALLIPGIVDGTGAVVIAWLVSWFLYRARCQDYAQKKTLLGTNAELREIMAIAAHDLRAPLLGVRDLLVLEEGEAPGSERQKKLHAHSVKTCGDLIHLVGRLIEAHAAEHRRAEIRALVVEDLCPLLRESIERFKAAAEAKKIEMVFQFPEKIATAKVDAEAFAQIIDNLIGNAVKYSPPGKKIGVELTSDQDQWVITVWDQGDGIPKDEVPQLFKKFYRGSGRPTAGESSSGLGLFIVKTLAEAMGGEVTYETKESGGACFTLKLAKEK